MKFSHLSAWVVCTLILLAGTCAQAQTTKPTAAADGSVEFRAQQAFTSRQYAVALPLLQQLADQNKAQPDKKAALEEQIRVCQKQIADIQAAAAQAPVGNDPAMSSETRKAHAKPQPGQVQEMSIKELGNFDYDADKGGNIPDDVKALSGAKLRLHGFMIPMDQADSITQFALVPSLFACCFGQPPQLQHTIVVNCPKGKAVSYYPDEITVEGTLKVNEKKEDGYIVSIFEVECSSVKPVAK
jgi:hypothetical protein